MPFFSILIWLAAVNIAAYFFIRKDKIRAINQEWRIPEKVFFLLCLLGGFVGVHCGMKRFRHKTKHFTFKFMVIFSALLWLVVLPCLFMR